MTVEDLAKQMMFLLEQGKGHYNINHFQIGDNSFIKSSSFELNDDEEGVLIY